MHKKTWGRQAQQKSERTKHQKPDRSSSHRLLSSSAYSSGRQNRGKILYPTLAAGALLVLWSCLCLFNIAPSYLLPAPWQVAEAFVKHADLLAHHAVSTLAEALLGLVAGSAIGVLFALVMDALTPLKKALQPLITLSQTVPTIAIAPLLVLWLGYGMLPKIVLVAVTCFFPVSVALLEGLGEVPRTKIELMQTMGASKIQIYRYLKIPASLPYFFSGLKMGAAYAIVAAVIAEWLGGVAGLGVYMTRVRKSYAYDEMFAVIFLIVALSVALVAAVRVAEKLCMPWKRAATCRRRRRGTAILFCFLAAAALGIGMALSASYVVFPYVSSSSSSASSSPFASSADVSQTSPEERQAVTLVLDYAPNTNHLGIYAAQSLGYYQEEGLELTIVQPPEDGAEALVGAGQATFGVSYQDTLANYLYAQEALPVEAVAGIVQHNTSGIMGAPEAGISRPRDIAHKRYATMQSNVEEAILADLVEADGGDWQSVALLPAGTTDEVSGLKTQLFDAIWSFEGWGVQNAALKHYPASFMRLADVNAAFDYYTPVLIANTSYLTENPDTVQRFLRATAKGYTYAAAHPVEAADILCAAAPETDSALAHASAAFLATRFKDDAPFWGFIDSKRWGAFYDWLSAHGVIDKELLQQRGYGFTNEYLVP